MFLFVSFLTGSAGTVAAPFFLVLTATSFSALFEGRPRLADLLVFAIHSIRRFKAKIPSFHCFLLLLVDNTTKH